jgi:hypothetical protein
MVGDPVSAKQAVTVELSSRTSKLQDFGLMLSHHLVQLSRVGASEFAYQMIFGELKFAPV